MSSRTLLVAVQTLLLTPLWTLLLWLTNATLSLLEWSFAIDLLDPATMGSVARTLTAMRATLTEPWLVALRALAAIALLYHAIVRRRMADSVGEAAAMTAMILAGLWIITNPAGTVGEINRALNQTGLGAVAAVSAADPTSGRAAFGDGLRAIFATAIQGPWCYLEFGDVDWCRDPRRLDPRLSDTARSLRTKLLDDARCDRAGAVLPGGSGAAARSAAARRRPQQRRALPRLPDQQRRSATRSTPTTRSTAHCAPTTTTTTAAEQPRQAAQWRTESGTWPRAGGLMLITAGSLGMLALLLFIALRLLGAAILTVVYLLLAPLAVLAPTIGESGRAAFRGWATRLLGALVAKLIYAIFLGVVLLTLSILDGLGSLGWWTQWLLIAAFWWIVFIQRHEVLAYARLGHARDRRARPAPGRRPARRPPAHARCERYDQPGRRLIGRAGRTTGQAFTATRSRLADERGEDAQRRRTEQLGPARAADQAPGRAAPDRRATQRARAGRHTPRASKQTVGALDARRPRIVREIAAANSSGDRRRALRLLDRDARLHRQAQERRAPLVRARDTIARAEARDATGREFRRGDVEERRLLLDREARKRRGVVPGPRADPDAYRDYQRLAPLANLSADAYRALPAGRAAPRAIDDRPRARRTPRADGSSTPADARRRALLVARQPSEHSAASSANRRSSADAASSDSCATSASDEPAASDPD